MKDTKKNSILSNEVVDAVLKNVESYKKNKYSESQLRTMLDPTISNAIFHRDKAVLEAERFATLVSLARVLDDENMKKAVIGLKYNITVDEKKKD